MADKEKVADDTGDRVPPCNGMETLDILEETQGHGQEDRPVGAVEPTGGAAERFPAVRVAGEFEHSAKEMPKHGHRTCPGLAGLLPDLRQSEAVGQRVDSGVCEEVSHSPVVACYVGFSPHTRVDESRAEVLW